MEALRVIWLFFQDQILGMKWLNLLIGNLLSALGLSTGTVPGGALQFFIYDTIKIFILLSVLIFGISYIQSYFPPERTKQILGRFHGIGANSVAALLGTVTPFCSCSSIPIFMGFTSAGLPVGVTFSFLISSPMVDLGSLVLLMSIFGARVAVVYVIFGLIIAVIGGSLLEKLGMGERRRSLFAVHRVQKLRLFLFFEERQLIGRVEGNFLLIHHVQQFRNQLRQADKSFDLRFTIRTVLCDFLCGGQLRPNLGRS